MGRALMFETPEILESRINEYFQICDQGEDVEELSKRGDLVTYHRKIPYTIEGLSLHLDCSTESIRNYGKREEYFAIVSRAKTKIYESWIKNGFAGSYNVKMVALCLAANNPAYRINQQHDLVIESMEDKLRRIRQERLTYKGNKVLPAAIPKSEIID